MSEFHASKSLRVEVRERARGWCEYCRSHVKYSLSSFVLDHIVPLSLGGRTVSENLALACSGCNLHKAARRSALDPLTGRMVALFNPRVQKWSDHFDWNEDSSEIIGRTPTGRATVEALQLNREGLRNLRGVLKMVGSHPTTALPEPAP